MLISDIRLPLHSSAVGWIGTLPASLYTPHSTIYRPLSTLSGRGIVSHEAEDASAQAPIRAYLPENAAYQRFVGATRGHPRSHHTTYTIQSGRMPRSPSRYRRFRIQRTRHDGVYIPGRECTCHSIGAGDHPVAPAKRGRHGDTPNAWRAM